MERRHFLMGALGTSAALRWRSVRTQPALVTRGAIVIGVDNAGNLTPLHAARSGARSVAKWLSDEGFDVKLFVDDPAPVTVSAVFSAIDAYIRAGTLEQLVVYFAGHGFISGTISEFWMLSGAPQNPNEAVSLTESARYAEESGIPNVVFISDACRSRADTLGVQRLQGGVLFPATTNARLVSEVDQFLAARIGASAFEVNPAGNPAAAQGIFTGCFLEAYRNPYPSMVHTLDGRPVIPNRRLKAYLSMEVPKKAQSLSVAYSQVPDSKVYSDEPTFIAHVSSGDRMPAPARVPGLSDVVEAEIRPRGAVGGLMGGALAGAVAGGGFSRDVRELRASSGYGKAVENIVQARGKSTELAARSGFALTGRHVVAVTTRSGVTTNFKNSVDRDAPSSLVEVQLADRPSASVALRFADGSGTVLAALRDYAGNVVVGPAGVSNVSYVPSRQSPMRSDYERESARLETLRASVAAAAQYGVFRFDGPKAERGAAAEQMADRIRILKGIDPTLGLYAAYAYDDARLRDKVRSVHQYMSQTLGPDLCDIAMLAGELSGVPAAAWNRVVPCCPMLSQGWGLLRVLNVQLPEVLAGARDHLRVSLWNTFDPTGMDIVESALRSGAVS